MAQRVKDLVGIRSFPCHGRNKLCTYSPPRGGYMTVLFHVQRFGFSSAADREVVKMLSRVSCSSSSQYFIPTVSRAAVLAAPAFLPVPQSLTCSVWLGSGWATPIAFILSALFTDILGRPFSCFGPFVSLISFLWLIPSCW